MKNCPYCAEEIQDNAIVCRFCGLDMQGRSTRPTTVIAPTTVVAAGASRTWSPGAAAVLSFFFPGLGQLYKGRIALGFVLFVATVVGYLSLILPGVVIHIFVIVDAYNGRAKSDPLPTPVPRAPDPRTPEQIAAAKRTEWRALKLLFGAMGLFLALTLVAHYTGLIDRAAAGRRPAGESPAASDEETWSRRLQAIVTSAGERCAAVVTTYHQGQQPGTGANFWNVRCSDGDTYAIQMTPGATPRVLSCTVLKQVAKVDCFRTFTSLER